MKLGIEKYVTFTHCKVMMPWFPHRRGQDCTSRFRRLVAELDPCVANRGIVTTCWAGFLFLISSSRQIAIALRTNFRRCQSEYGLGLFTQAMDLLYWTVGLNHSASAYYAQRISVRRDRRSWCSYIDHYEHCAFLDVYSDYWDVRACVDKRALFSEFRARDLPTIDVLFIAEAGRLTRQAGPSGAVEHDIIMKPADGQMSEDLEYWRYSPETRSFRHYIYTPSAAYAEGIYQRDATWPELLRHFESKSSDRPMIMQEWLRNPPHLEAICPHVIANFRVVTSILNGDVQLVSVVLRMGFDRTRWPNTTYQTNVDPLTKTLGKATSRIAVFGISDFHIETGAKVAGVKLDEFDDIVSLAIRGHRIVNTVPVVGWDIICTESKILIMEANLFWGADVSQLGGPLLGESSYPAACLAAAGVA